MATKDLNSSNIKKEELDDMTTCCICTEVYTDPKALPCIHTFCMKCLQQTGLKSNKGPGDEMPCPICRRMFKLPPEGFRGLPKNFFIENLIQSANVLVKSATSRVVCDACLDDNKGEADTEIPVADAYCLECKNKLCEKCSIEHRKFKFTRNHKLILITEYEESQNVMSVLAPSVCELHEQKVLDAYCAYCKTVVCAFCFIDDHKNHEGSHVSKFVDGFQKQMETNAEAIIECRSKADNKKTEFLKEKETIQKRVENLECYIEKRKDELKQLADKHAIALLESLSAIRQCKLKEIEMATCDIDTYISSLETYNSYSLKIIARGSPADICREFSNLSVRAVELQEQCQPMIEREIQSFDVIFRKSELEEFMQESCGSIIGEIEEEIDSKPKKISRASKVVELTDKLDKEITAHKSAQTDRDNFKKDLDTEKLTSKSLQTKIDELTDKLDKEITAHTSAQTDRDNFKKDLDTEKLTSKSLHTKIDELTDKLDKEITTHTSAQTDRDNFKKDLDAEKLITKSFRTDIAEHKVKLDKEIAAKTVAQTERDKFKQELDKEQLTNNSLKVSNANLIEEVNKYKESNKALEDNVEKLKRELEATKTDNRRHTWDPVLVQTIKTEAKEETNKRIFGLTMLDKELFVLSKWNSGVEWFLFRTWNSEVEVYDSTKLSFSRRWNLKELVNPNDMGSCNRNKCVYIFDCKDPSSEILRVDPNGNLIKKWSSGKDYGRLSVTGDSNIILTGVKTLKEYSPDGQLIRELNLSSDAGILAPSRAIKLANGQFMVSHGSGDAELHRVCVVDAAGKLQKSFGEKRGSAITQMDCPVYFVVDGNGFVMVADRRNSRVLLLDSDLTFKKEILSKEKHGFRDVNRILLDEPSGRLFVSDNDWHSTKKDGRILVFSF